MTNLENFEIAKENKKELKYDNSSVWTYIHISIQPD